MTVLVTAASKHGATAQIAEAIGATLTRRGIETTLLAPEDVADIAGYEAVVLGSAVYMGTWMKPAKALVERHREALAARPVWLFSSGPIGDPPVPKGDEAVNVADVLEATGARDHRLFAGAIDKSKLGFAERAVLKAVRAAEGDFRDWDDIEAWATSIADALTS